MGRLRLRDPRETEGCNRASIREVRLIGTTRAPAERMIEREGRRYVVAAAGGVPDGEEIRVYVHLEESQTPAVA